MADQYISTFKQKVELLKSIVRKAYENEIISQEYYYSFISRINNNEFRITIVGEFSSGKSTLIDALIGKDILPHSTSETTATLTYIHSVETGHPYKNKAVINFADGKSEIVEFSYLKEYVTAFSKKFDVFSSILNVDVYVHIENIDENIVIVDTPGLNGTNHYEDRTLQEISKADASIFLFSPSGIKATEQSFMKEELNRHQHSFFFVMNRIDDLRRTEGETVESKLKELSKDISERFFDNKVQVKKIYGVSALKALASKDHNIEKLYLDDQKTITKEDRERLWKESQFETFLNSLKEYLVNEKGIVFINSLATQLKLKLEEFLEQIEQRIVVNSPKEELPSVAIIKDEIKTIEARFNSYEKGLEKNVNSRMDSVEQNLRKYLSDSVNLGKQRFEDVKKVVESKKDIEDFELTYGKDGSKATELVNAFYNTQYNRIKQKITEDIISVKEDMVAEIRDLIPNVVNLKKKDINSVNIGSQTYESQISDNYSYTQEKIKDCDDKIKRLKEKEENARRIQSETESKRSDLRCQETSVMGKLNDLNSKINQLGTRPEAALVWKTREKQVKRSIFNPLRWIGDKYTTETESYRDYDYSAQEEYDKKKKKLNAEKSSLNSQLSAIRQQIFNLPDMEAELQSIIRDIERQLKEKDYQLNELQKEKETRKREMETGRLAFLNNRKQTLIKVLQDLLTDEKTELHISLRNESMICLKELRIQLLDIIQTYFKEQSNNYIKQLNDMLTNILSSTGNDDREIKKKILCNNKDKVNKMLAEVGSLIINHC